MKKICDAQSSKLLIGKECQKDLIQEMEDFRERGEDCEHYWFRQAKELQLWYESFYRKLSFPDNPPPTQPKKKSTS